MNESYVPVLTIMLNEMKKKHELKGFSYLDLPVFPVSGVGISLRSVLDEEIWETWKELDALEAGFNGDHLDNAITECIHGAIAFLILGDKLRMVRDGHLTLQGNREDGVKKL